MFFLTAGLTSEHAAQLVELYGRVVGAPTDYCAREARQIRRESGFFDESNRFASSIERRLGSRVSHNAKLVFDFKGWDEREMVKIRFEPNDATGEAADALVIEFANAVAEWAKSEGLTPVG